MKKFISILCTFLFLTGIISILTACNIKTDSSEPEAKQYSVRFYNGTDLISSVETSGNEVIDTPNLTAPAHFAFGGWYLDKDVWQQNFTGKEYEQKPLTSDLDVYAKWTQTEFQIQFETNGGTAVENSGSWTGKIDSEPTSSREHFRFDGWFTNSALSGERVSFPYTLTADTTLYAKWTQTEFQVSFEENGGETVQDGWFATIEKAPVSKYDGFILNGWYTDKNLENPAVFPMTLKENTTLYAKWIKSPALLSLKDIYAENEWNGYSFSTLKPTPYYEYSEAQKSGYWHFNSDGLPEIWN